MDCCAHVAKIPDIPWRNPDGTSGRRKPLGRRARLAVRRFNIDNPAESDDEIQTLQGKRYVPHASYFARSQNRNLRVIVVEIVAQWENALADGVDVGALGDYLPLVVLALAPGSHDRGFDDQRCVR